MGIRAQARESRTCIAGNADGSGKHQQDQQERRHKDPRIKREKEAGKDWECERPRQTAGKVQAGGSRVVPLGDPENEVTTHRAVDKTRARHRPGAQEARQEQQNLEDERAKIERRQAKRYNAWPKTTHQCRTPGRRRDVHSGDRDTQIEG